MVKILEQIVSHFLWAFVAMWIIPLINEDWTPGYFQCFFSITLISIAGSVFRGDYGE